jgi:hypothetical protein
MAPIEMAHTLEAHPWALTGAPHLSSFDFPYRLATLHFPNNKFKLRTANLYVCDMFNFIRQG